MRLVKTHELHFSFRRYETTEWNEKRNAKKDQKERCNESFWKVSHFESEMAKWLKK